MMETLAAHKIVVILAIALGGFFAYRIHAGKAAGNANGVPVSPYSSTAPSGSGAGGGLLVSPDQMVPTYASGGTAPGNSAGAPAADGGGSAAAASFDAPAAFSTAVASPTLQIGDVVAPSGSGYWLTGGAPGGVVTGDPEHTAFITGQSDVDPFNAGGPQVGGASPGARDDAAGYYAGAPAPAPAPLAVMSTGPAAAPAVSMPIANPAPYIPPPPVYARGGTAVAS
jgi:hypothetical protein